MSLTSRILAWLTGALFALLLLWFGLASAQMVAPAPCDQSLACVRERVRDLKDYREFLEDQLALAKALNQDLRVQLAERAGELKTCREAPKELPPREGRP